MQRRIQWFPFIDPHLCIILRRFVSSGMLWFMLWLDILLQL